MISKIAAVLILVLSMLPERATSQSSLQSTPLTMDIRFNGTGIGGACSKNDSILTVSVSDGITYQIVSIEMSIGEKYYRIPGNNISSEMRSALKKSKSGDELSFLLRVVGRTGPMRLVAATYFIE